MVTGQVSVEDKSNKNTAITGLMKRKELRVEQTDESPPSQTTRSMAVPRSCALGMRRGVR